MNEPSVDKKPSHWGAFYHRMTVVIQAQDQADLEGTS